MSEAATILDTDDAMDLIALKTLKGDVRDFLLDEQKHNHQALPWNMRGEEAQAEAIDRADSTAERLVRKVWELAMTLDRPTIVARMVQGKRKGEKIAFELQINASDQLRHAATRMVSQHPEKLPPRVQGLGRVRWLPHVCEEWALHRSGRPHE